MVKLARNKPTYKEFLKEQLTQNLNGYKINVDEITDTFI